MLLNTKMKEATIHNEAFDFILIVSYDKACYELLEMIEDAKTHDEVYGYANILFKTGGRIRSYNLQKCSNNFKRGAAARIIGNNFLRQAIVRN